MAERGDQSKAFADKRVAMNLFKFAKKQQRSLSTMELFLRRCHECDRPEDIH